MKIGWTYTPGPGATDALLYGLGEALVAEGHDIAGAVQAETPASADACAHMEILVLPHGPRLGISQDLGPGSAGCRLDAPALEAAVGLVDAALGQGPKALILNKFGKQEAEGRGFRDVIGRALMADIPVLVGVNETNRAAFDVFAVDMAVELPPNRDALRQFLIGA